MRLQAYCTNGAADSVESQSYRSPPRGSRLYITLSFGSGLNSIERFFDYGELALEGTILLEPGAETANGDTDGVMV